MGRTIVLHVQRRVMVYGNACDLGSERNMESISRGFRQGRPGSNLILTAIIKMRSGRCWVRTRNALSPNPTTGPRLFVIESHATETLPAEGGAVSIQVFNEFVAVARRKFGKQWEKIRGALDILRAVPLTVETKPCGCPIFDPLIIAAALHLGARTLYSDDMRVGPRLKVLRFAIRFCIR